MTTSDTTETCPMCREPVAMSTAHWHDGLGCWRCKPAQVAIYSRCTGEHLFADKRYTVRQWDWSDGVWTDDPAATNVDRAHALAHWCVKTEDGTKRASVKDGDYFAIFPADTYMHWSGVNTIKRGRE